MVPRLAAAFGVMALVACWHKAGLVDYPVSEDDPQPTLEPCDQLAADACTRSDCVAIQASQEVVDHPCVLEPKAVGCMAKDAACGDALTYARDPDNNVYWFADTCVPPGWEVLPYPAGRSEPPPSC